MKTVPCLCALLLLAGCATEQQFSLQAPPLPPQPATHVRNTATHKQSRQPAKISSAGPLKLAMVGGYMDAQEHDLRIGLRGTPVMRVGDDLIVSLRDDGIFSGQRLSGQGAETLVRLAGLLRHYDRSAVQVNGYMDTAGEPGTNLELSQERARKVADALVSDGVASSRLSAEGFGAAHLRVATGPGKSEPRNRRVEIRVIAHPDA